MPRSKLAVWSFVLVLFAYFLIWVSYFEEIFILSLFFWLGWIMGMITFILGIISLRRIKKKKLKGRGFAIATIVLSSILIFVFLCFLYSLWALS